ncbi:uncharacterized protein LOC130744964 [Lotus japonicus]|uniref:uncharacterized protein LOC130744964 n=1 Tax=Lotus japonicus TaxID=34305 RepID=UPI00258D1B7A|nr:uncharacterized protein LOC130744964 [Lotus japonicus]
MIILSLNSRGIGSRIKQNTVNGLIWKHKVDLVCIQETKLQELDVGTCRRIWGDPEFEWEWSPADNRSGGLLCLWKKDNLQIVERVVEHNFIFLCGRKSGCNDVFAILNIYAPCDREGKQALWERLVVLKESKNLTLWCAIGDFNAVLSPSERRGISGGSHTQRGETDDFNQFIDKMELHDLPLVGKKFTWIRPNGQQMSRLDRALVSHEWLDYFPGLVQEVLHRDVSDHSPILLRASTVDWGPKPFRVMNCWFDDVRFKPFVRDTRQKLQVEGWAAYVLKEKLKILKGELKTWNRDVFEDLNRKKKEVIEKINELEKKAEETDLQLEELDQRKLLEVEFWQNARRLESLFHKKARISWVKFGDANTSFFHSLVNFRRRMNAVAGLNVNGVWCEEPQTVKAGVKEFFAQKYRRTTLATPSLDGVPFKALPVQISQSLESPFAMDELKEAVWSCANDKSPGPDV